MKDHLASLLTDSCLGFGNWIRVVYGDHTLVLHKLNDYSISQNARTLLETDNIKLRKNINQCVEELMRFELNGHCTMSWEK